VIQAEFRHRRTIQLRNLQNSLPELQQNRNPRPGEANPMERRDDLMSRMSNISGIAGMATNVVEKIHKITFQSKRKQFE